MPSSGDDSSRPYGTTPISAFLDALDWAGTILHADEVAAQWNEPSALAQMTVGEVAGHLYLAMRLVDHRLDAPPPAADDATTFASFATWYAQAGMHDPADIDLPRHRVVRDDGRHVAARGAAVVVARFDAHAASLSARLPTESGTRLFPVGTTGDAVATLDAYLPSRVVEMLVHGDDLAASVGITPPPTPPEGAVTVALAFLVDAARAAQGDLAVLRAFTRRERADGIAVL